MKIERNFQPHMTIEQFAQTYDLVMQISERHMDAWQRSRGMERFTARFKRADLKEGSILRGAYGNGNTEAEAIQDYARQISGCFLVCDDREPRLEVRVPILVEPPQ